MHGATANKTETMREAMIVTYYPDGTMVDELCNPSRFYDAQNFLGGKREGDSADSEMNPVLYRRWKHQEITEIAPADRKSVV